MKKRIKVVLAMFLFAVPSFAQTNILEQLGINNWQILYNGASSFAESKDAYYFIRYTTTKSLDTAFNFPFNAPLQLSISKYDKHTFQQISSAALVGDTLQNDSVFLFSAELLLHQNRIHFVFNRLVKDSTGNYSDIHRYYIQLDTNLAINVPEKRIDTGNDNTTIVCLIPKQHSDNVILATSYFGTQNLDYIHNAYYEIDTQGMIANQGILGYPVNVPNSPSFLYNVYPFQDDKYFVWGLNIFNTTSGAEQFYIADSAMNITDTFLREELEGRNIAMLPSGSFFSLNLAGVGGYKKFGKWSPANNFIPTFAESNNVVDSIDAFHIGNRIRYNPFDNKVYVARVTHRSTDGQCYYPASEEPYPYGYAEINCIDTSLQKEWSKYIKFNFRVGGCMSLYSLTVPVNDSGFLIGGKWRNDNWDGQGKDTSKLFLYHIKSSTVTDSGNTIGIDELPLVEIRNRIMIYPNPARDILHISDVKGTLKRVTAYDILGRAVLTKSLSKQEGTIDISAFDKGMYLLKCEDKTGEVFINKVMKE